MSTEQGADAPAVDIDAIEAAAKAVVQWPIDPEVRRSLRSDQAAFIDVCDPSTVLTLVGENRRLQRRLVKEAGQTGFVTNELVIADAKVEALTEVLTAFVNETILTVASGKYWRCVSDACLGLVTAESRGDLAHRDGCPVPAAEAALRTGGEARDNGGNVPT